MKYFKMVEMKLVFLSRGDAGVREPQPDPIWFSDPPI